MTRRYLIKRDMVFLKESKPLPGGMYLIYLPNTRYFEMIMGKDQEFSLETDTADFINTLSFKGSEENQIFLDFQRFMVGAQKRG